MRAFAHRPFLAGTINHFAALPLHFISKNKRLSQMLSKSNRLSLFVIPFQNRSAKQVFFEIDPWFLVGG
jgi:hypothetical protein